MGIEPTYPAWKAGVLAVELHPHIFVNYKQILVRYSITVHFVSTLRTKAANQRPTFIAALARYRILYLSFGQSCGTLTTMGHRRVVVVEGEVGLEPTTF